MYNTVRKTRKFNTDDEKELADYDAILNNPLCAIVAERKEKLTTKHFNEDGVPTYHEDKFLLLVTWEEKSLL